MKPFSKLLAILCGGLFLTSCASTTPTSRSREYATAESRPGLGTAWGEDVDSPVRSVHFERASHPLTIEKLYYNDDRGLRAMIPGIWRRGSTRWFESEDGSISYGLRKAGWGGMWSGYRYDGRNFVRGDRGDRYEIVIRNETPEPLAIVVSVDGLNALNGRPAGLNGEGYLVDGRGTLTVEGFRRSLDEVAAFRFSRVSRSYAALTQGDTRNVGVIGLAVFAERGSRLGRDERELRTRRGADPFPERFASPPRS